MEYEYDTTGVYFCYFLLSILALWLVPTTIAYVLPLLPSNLARHSAGTRSRTTNSGCCKCASCVQLDTRRALAAKRTLKNPRLSRPFVLWLAGWLVFAVLASVVVLTPVAEEKVLFDPYEILGVSLGATPPEIKRQYKKQSLKWHPDKNPDAADEAQEIFIKITKAYKVLTDDDTRKNWEDYGDPDGKQSVAHGIALPQWIVDPSNKSVVLAVYALLFGLLLPVVVGKWWAKSKKFTKDRVLNYTMGVFFQECKENFNTRKMLELLSTAVEFKDDVPWRGQRDMDAVMALYKQVRDSIMTKTGEKLDLPKKYNAPYVFKAFVVLHAHLFRVPIEDPELQADALVMIPKFLHLTSKGLLQIASAHFWLEQSLNAVEICRMLIQAVPTAWKHTESSELHQLPHFSADKIKNLRHKKKQLKTVPQLMELPTEDRQLALTAVGLSDSEISDVLAVGGMIPKVTIERAYFECVGEEIITPGSLVTFVMELRAVHYGPPQSKSGSSQAKKVLATATDSETVLESPPAFGNEDEDDEDGFVLDDEDDGDGDGDDDGPPRKKATRLTKLLSGSYWRNPNQPAHCPFLPQVNPDSNTWKRPNYWMWLANTRANRCIGAPVQVNNLVPVSVESVSSGSNAGRRKVKFRFYAPANQGNYTFTAMVQCDTYVGIDVRQEVKLVVKPLHELEEKRRAAQDKEAWKDLEDEERLERDALLNSVEPGQTAGGTAATEEDEGDDDYSSSDEDDSSDDEN